MNRLVVFLLFSAALPGARDPVAFVNPLIGTQKSRIGYGGTMPFVSPPFAMTNWTPQTRQNKISITSYGYDDRTGFIGTHQPAIWMGDYGYVTLMPQVGELRTAPEARQLAYSHGDETAKPDYYAVSLGAAGSARIRAFQKLQRTTDALRPAAAEKFLVAHSAALRGLCAVVAP